MEIYEINKHKIFYFLLKNDFTLFGPIVRQLFFENLSLKKIMSDSKVITIDAFGFYFFKDILERDFDKYLVNIYEYNVNQDNRSNLHTLYTLIFDNVKFKISVYYNLGNDFKRNYFNNLNIMFDVDTLCLDRAKLSFLPVLNIHKTHPFPLGLIMNNIKKKQYKLLINNNYITSTEFYLIDKMNLNGWKNYERKIVPFKSLSFANRQVLLKEDCAICKNKHNEDTIMLPCNHYFHYKCIKKYISVFIENKKMDKVLNCPYCFKIIYIKDII